MTSAGQFLFGVVLVLAGCGYGVLGFWQIGACGRIYIGAILLALFALVTGAGLYNLLIGMTR